MHIRGPTVENAQHKPATNSTIFGGKAIKDAAGAR
jgi:hypothetical protein